MKREEIIKQRNNLLKNGMSVECSRVDTGSYTSKGGKKWKEEKEKKVVQKSNRKP